QLWTHNMNVDGAAPFLMAQATTGTPTVCSVSVPTLNAATPGNAQVTLDWSPANGATGYNVYYDQAGKAQFVANAGNNTTYLDTGLSNGVEYCYKVTAYDGTCETGFSTILCAIPTSQGQATDPAGASTMETGIYTGKGKTKTYAPLSAFLVGDGVVIRVYVVDGVTGLPLADATVDLLITGPESLTLLTGPSDANGMAEATWQTKAPGKRNPGTAPGIYSVEVKGITAAGYHWDGTPINVSFILE
ncbi:MAG: fibronectin type III domain-containing protein, partial [Chloroflexota bacterium]